jgi:hypothetical protein
MELSRGILHNAHSILFKELSQEVYGSAIHDATGNDPSSSNVLSALHTTSSEARMITSQTLLKFDVLLQEFEAENIPKSKMRRLREKVRSN